MQSQHMFNDCIAKAAGGCPASAVSRRPYLPSLGGCLVVRDAPSGLSENPLKGSTQEKLDGDIET